MTALILAQHDGKALDKGTLHAVTAAQPLGEVHLLVAGSGAGAVASAAAKVRGVAKVLHADAPALAEPTAETLADLVLTLAPAYDHLLVASTTFGRNVMPRVAARLDVAQISDIVAVLGPDTFSATSMPAMRWRR